MNFFSNKLYLNLTNKTNKFNFREREGLTCTLYIHSTIRWFVHKTALSVFVIADKIL